MIPPRNRRVTIGPPNRPLRPRTPRPRSKPQRPDVDEQPQAELGAALAQLQGAGSTIDCCPHPQPKSEL